ncbi:MAG: AIR synthase related protein, partial [Thermoleophilia bacterium]
MADAHTLAALVRDAPGLRDKRELSLLRHLGGGDGDDAALVPHGDEYLVLCAEAIAPAFCAADPFGAGAACVATNVADVRAMGGEPLALVDTVVSPDRDHAGLV